MKRWLGAVMALWVVSSVPAQSLRDANFDDAHDYADLFTLADSWDLHADRDELLQLHQSWHSPANWGAPADSVDLVITDSGQEIQVYADHLGTAHLVYTFRDGESVLQLGYASVHPSGAMVRQRKQLTFREPGSIPGSGPILRDVVLTGPPHKSGPFYAVWPSPERGISLIRFNTAGYRTLAETLVPRVDRWVNRLDAVADADNNLHVATTESFFAEATQTIRYHKFDRNGKRLLGPVDIGQRITQSGWSELFRARICLDGELNVLIVWEVADEVSPASMRRVNGMTGVAGPLTTLFAATTEAACRVNAGGEVAMAYMFFEIGTGRNIFFAMLDPDLQPKFAPKRLLSTFQQSDGARIAAVGNDYYVAWNEHSDQLTRVARVRPDGTLKGGIRKLSGPGVGFPSPVRLDVDPQGHAHVVHGDSEHTLGKLNYVKLKID